MIVVRLDSGQTRNRLGEIARVVDRPRAMLQSSAGYVRRELQAHFKRRDRKGNRLGGRRTHFWSEVRRSTQIGEVTERDATIVIGDFRFSQKLHGGTIRAKSVRSLTIPVDPQAHGRRASVFERETGLKLFAIRQTPGSPRGILATRTAGSNFLQVRYVLTPRVHQRPDPKALPPDGLDDAAIAGAEDYLKAKIRESQRAS